MSLSTDTLLFSIVLVLTAIHAALPYDEGSNQILLAGLGIAVLALLSSIVLSVIYHGSGASDDGNADH